MEIELKPLQKKDYNKAISFAVTGMNFNCYTDSPLLLKLYGKYFLYMELERASQVIAAYYDGKLVGLLLADMKGETKLYRSRSKRAYIRLVDFIQKIFFKGGVSAYEEANAEIFKRFSSEYEADGEICFLAADPDAKINGIGTRLLRELERRETGKRIYLFTDDNCTYQFYEHRGFERVGEKQITLSLSGKGEVPLSCYLYSKICGDGEKVNAQ